MQLADRLILQKELNPTAQHQQIILSAKPAFPLLEQCTHLHQSDPQISAGKRLRGGKGGKERHIGGPRRVRRSERFSREAAGFSEG